MSATAEATKIVLCGGPWNGKEIDDLGTVVIKMAIANKWDGDRPALGSKTGYAIYEPETTRKNAFFLENVWEGQSSGTVEAV